MKFEDVRILWQQIENEMSIDNAEMEVACKFIRRSSRVIDMALTNVEEKMKGEYSTKRLENSISNNYNVKTKFSDMGYKEKISLEIISLNTNLSTVANKNEDNPAPAIMMTGGDVESLLPL
ncbi:15179_t:CDS:2, partial [Dentiscutata erythropus]